MVGESNIRLRCHDGEFGSSTDPRGRAGRALEVRKKVCTRFLYSVHDSCTQAANRPTERARAALLARARATATTTATPPSAQTLGAADTSQTNSLLERADVQHQVNEAPQRGGATDARGDAVAEGIRALVAARRIATPWAAVHTAEETHLGHGLADGSIRANASLLDAGLSAPRKGGLFLWPAHAPRLPARTLAPSWTGCQGVN